MNEIVPRTIQDLFKTLTNLTKITARIMHPISRLNASLFNITRLRRVRGLTSSPLTLRKSLVIPDGSVSKIADSPTTVTEAMPNLLSEPLETSLRPEVVDQNALGNAFAFQAYQKDILRRVAHLPLSRARIHGIQLQRGMATRIGGNVSPPSSLVDTSRSSVERTPMRTIDDGIEPSSSRLPELNSQVIPASNLAQEKFSPHTIKPVDGVFELSRIANRLTTKARQVPIVTNSIVGIDLNSNPLHAPITIAPMAISQTEAESTPRQTAPNFSPQNGKAVPIQNAILGLQRIRASRVNLPAGKVPPQQRVSQVQVDDQQANSPAILGATNPKPSRLLTLEEAQVAVGKAAVLNLTSAAVPKSVPSWRNQNPETEKPVSAGPVDQARSSGHRGRLVSIFAEMETAQTKLQLTTHATPPPLSPRIDLPRIQPFQQSRAFVGANGRPGDRTEFPIGTDMTRPELVSHLPDQQSRSIEWQRPDLESPVETNELRLKIAKMLEEEARRYLPDQ